MSLKTRKAYHPKLFLLNRDKEDQIFLNDFTMSRTTYVGDASRQCCIRILKNVSCQLGLGDTFNIYDMNDMNFLNISQGLIARFLF
jgi:hypothetical protein